MARRKTVMVVDGQGGGFGKSIIEKLKKANIDARIIGVGTTTAATTAMIKAGADDAATGENAVIYNAGYADYIMGGIGIVAANSMLGEITPAMANAIASSQSQKVLIPVNKCSIYIAGVTVHGLSDNIDEAISRIMLDCAE